MIGPYDENKKFKNLRKHFHSKDTIYRKPGFCEYDINEILKEIPY